MLKDLKPSAQLLSYPGWFANICVSNEIQFSKTSREAKAVTNCPKGRKGKFTEQELSAMSRTLKVSKMKFDFLIILTWAWFTLGQDKNSN